MQQHHLRQRCVFSSEYDQNQRKHDARNAANARPAHGDQLARRVSLTVHAAAAKAADLDDIDEAIRLGEPIIAFEHKRRVAFADAHRTIDDDGHIQITA